MLARKAHSRPLAPLYARVLVRQIKRTLSATDVGRLYEVGEERGSARCPIAFDTDVVDRAAEGLCDGLGDVMSCRSGVVHRDAGAIAAEAVADVVLLLEMVGEREIDKRSAGGRELHGGDRMERSRGRCARGL
jgi:hypothetical protein